MCREWAAARSAGVEGRRRPGENRSVSAGEGVPDAGRAHASEGRTSWQLADGQRGPWGRQGPGGQGRGGVKAARGQRVKGTTERGKDPPAGRVTGKPCKDLKRKIRMP